MDAGRLWGISEGGWGAIIAAAAFILSLFSLWYTTFRRGRPTFACSKWTAIGLSADGVTGAAFTIQVSVINNGNRPLVLKDLMLVAKTSENKEIYYDPILLFDLRQYIADMGKDDRIARAQRGQVTLPIIIPPNQHFDFPYEILFMPYDKKTAVATQKDAPFTLKLYGRTNRSKHYQLVAFQEFQPDDVRQLRNGTFAGVLSTASIEKREAFIHSKK